MAGSAGSQGTGGDLHGPRRLCEGTARPTATVSRTGNIQGVCHAGRTTGRRSDRGCPRPGRPPGVRAEARLRGHGGRASRLPDGEAHDRRHRPAGGGARRMKLIYEHSQPGRRASTLPRPDLPVPNVPEELRRAEPPRLPEVAEPEVLRHFTELSTRTFGIDTGFYPLGSCTMKHNPRVNERVVNLPGFRDLHPLQEEEGSQGALELMWRLQEILAEVAGLPAVSLQPAAGSQGELTGLMLMRAYFADRGEARRKIVVADTAHGTNPASVTMAGYELQKVETDERGNINIAHLREMLDCDRPKSIGKVRGYCGPFGVFVRSYAYIRSFGPALREMSEVAVLNANYLLARLTGAYELPFDRLCMHEFVLSARRLKREHGITALDLAKRLMDYGFHPPTIYFPLIVPEALMIEPTETEAKETLDAFCDAMVAIVREAAEKPDVLKEAPHARPVKRHDEVRAVKQPIVKYGFDDHEALEPPEPRQVPAET